MTSLLFILLSIIFIVLPLWALIDYMVPQINEFLGNRDEIMDKFNTLKVYMSDKPFLKDIDMSDAALFSFLQNLTKYVPNILNSVMEVVVNIIVTFFLCCSLCKFIPEEWRLHCIALFLSAVQVNAKYGMR